MYAPTSTIGYSLDLSYLLIIYELRDQPFFKYLRYVDAFIPNRIQSGKYTDLILTLGFYRTIAILSLRSNTPRRRDTMSNTQIVKCSVLTRNT